MSDDHDLFAEQAVLGSIQDSGGRAFEELADFDPGAYYLPAHEELHRLLEAKFRAGEAIDNAVVAGLCENIRGLDATYFHTLTLACTAWINAGHHAAKVMRLAALRRARQVGTRLTGMGSALAEDADALDGYLDERRVELDAIGVARYSNVTTFADVADEAIDLIGNQKFTPTPWADLNFLIQGWMPAHMYTLGARPATGKTLIAVQAAIAAAQAGLGVAYYTWEMSGARLYQRGLANIAKVDVKKIQKGNLSEAEWRAIARADHEVLRSLPIVVEGASGWSAQQVSAHARLAHRKRPIDLVFIDHIGRVAPGPTKRHSREQEVADASNRFLDLCHGLNASVVVCTQLNREPAKRSDQRPVLTDIRESDVLEQNSDVVILMHRDREKTPNDLDLLVAKNRDGVDGPVHLDFEGHYSRAIDRPYRGSDAARGRAA